MVIQPATATSATPLISAASTWKRCCPYERRLGRRPAADHEGVPGERQCRRIRQHMAGIGQQGQRAGKDAADRLHDHEAAGQNQRQQQAPLIMGMGMNVPVTMAVMMAMVLWP